MKGLLLTIRTEVAGAARDFNALDGVAADFAGQTFPFVDVSEVQIGSERAVGLEVVPGASTAMFERELKHMGDTLEDFFDFCWFNVFGFASGADFGAKKRFVGVDIADTGHQTLLQQGLFNSDILPAGQLTKYMF